MTIWITTNTPGAEIWSRDGLKPCDELEFLAHDDVTASIEAVGNDIVLEQAGVLDIPIETMDELCTNWLHERGFTDGICNLLVEILDATSLQCNCPADGCDGSCTYSKAIAMLNKLDPDWQKTQDAT